MAALLFDMAIRFAGETDPAPARPGYDPRAPIEMG